MDKRQGTTLRLGVVVFALMGLFPPWEHTYSFRLPGQESIPAGYAPIFLPPQPDKAVGTGGGGIRLDFGRLGVQWALVCAITAGIMATQKPS